MKTVAPALKTAIRSAHDIKALPRLTAEWNLNRYYDTVVSNGVANWEDIENDVDMFPIDSIVEPIRPSKGINKARINYATIADSYHSPMMPRYYIASLEDPYKYWISPTPSTESGAIGNVAPQVIYEKSIKSNKIVVTVENTWASPTTWSIQTTNDSGASWQTASSSPAIGPDGRATLYWTGAAWSSTKPASVDATTALNGVRVVVSRLGGGRDIQNNPTTARTRFGMATTTGASSYFSLIEMSARLEMDLSDDLISVNDTFDGGEANQITPVGTITSNVASLSIWNGDNVFANTMEGLLEPNVKMNLEYIYTIDDKQYVVPQFSMFVDSWQDSGDTVDVDLSDASKYLSLLYPREAKYEKMTLAQIVYQLLDSVGFTDYNVVRYSNINDFRIPVFWVDGTQTIWEIFDELSTATQSLIYFDGEGRLNVRSREQAFDPNRPVDWTLRANTSGNELSDIVELKKSGQYDSNLIKVKYKQTSWAEETNGIVQNEIVWSPDDTVVLRSTPLLGNISLNDGAFLLSPAEAVHWPYEGIIQIEGEFISFKAKHFNYRKPNGDWASAWVEDQKQYDEYNEIAPYDLRVNNHFSGYFLIDERGVWNSTPVAHVPDAKGWESKRYTWGHNGTSAVGTSWNNGSCVQWWRGSSLLRLVGAGELGDEAQWAVVSRNVPSEAYYHTFGTRFRFNGAGNHKGGIVFNATGDGDGYYIELRPTNTIENKDRDSQDEITIYAIHGNNIKQMKANWKAPDLIVQDTWHDLEVSFNPNGHYITIWLDGKRVMTDSISPSNYRHAATNRFGMFIRGNTNMDFEYIYALSGNEPTLDDDASFLDRVRGGYIGDNWQRDRVYRQTSGKRRFVKRKGKFVKAKKPRNRKYQYVNFMDDFGPYVHEVREFDVKFDPAPVKSSFLYFSNDWQVICPEYRGNSHGAYFILANASRTNAVVMGTDDASFMSNPVEQQLSVFGRALVIGEDEEVEVRNDDMIRARGEIVADIDSDWVQSEDAAQAVADWIAEHWAKGADQLEVEVFGNPLFELGDVVAVEYPDKNMTSATHQYYVTGIDTEFDAGITTSLTLQRKN